MLIHPINDATIKCLVGLHCSSSLLIIAIITQCEYCCYCKHEFFCKASGFIWCNISNLKQVLLILMLLRKVSMTMIPLCLVMVFLKAVKWRTLNNITVSKNKDLKWYKNQLQPGADLTNITSFHIFLEIRRISEMSILSWQFFLHFFLKCYN